MQSKAQYGSVQNQASNCETEDVLRNTHLVSNAVKDEDQLLSAALTTFQTKIDTFIQHCMLVGGYDEANEGSKEYVAFVSTALEYEPFFSHERKSGKKQKVIPFSFDPKRDKALKIYQREYSLLLLQCMIDSGFPIEIDVESASFSKFKTLALELQHNKLNSYPSTLEYSSKSSKPHVPSKKVSKKEATIMHESKQFTTYLYVENDEKFNLKIFNDIPEDHISVENELEIAKNFTHPGLRKSLTRVNVGNANGILMEWIDGSNITNVGKFQVADFLLIGREIVSALVDLHRSKIIHNNLTTDHIIVDQKHKRAYIIGMRLASKLDGDFLANYVHDAQRNPKFISPEQSGWINQRIDFRSDLYSLGVIFYYMLVGNLPYESENPLLMTQAHLGQVPDSPDVLDDSIPIAVSSMVLKLLEKKADDRYNCAKGLLFDLEMMASEYVNDKHLSEISLASNDISDTFYLPQKLYGRESSYQQLLASFDGACSGNFNIIVVTSSGGGQGKTFLVEDLQGAIAQRNSIFVRGKFNQSLKNEPFAALIQAIDHFCSIVLMGGQDTISFFKERIQTAVGNECKLLTNVIPNLELLIGEQPLVTSPTSGEDAKNRFQYAFLRFIRALCSSSYPVVMFLDDLQWADEDSISFFNILVNDDSLQYFLLIYAYREDDITEKRILRNNAIIEVSNLGFDDVNNIVADTLKRPISDTFPLSAFIYEKTKGNLFFIMQILLQLKEHGLIYFCYDGYCWKWDTDQFQGFNITDHVIPLLVRKISKLKNSTRYILKVLSCIGSRFHRSILSLITDDTNEIKDAIADGFIVQMDSLNYRFSHDYMQEAVKSTFIDEVEKKTISFFIGKQIWDKSSSNERSENLFLVTNLLNSSMDLITTYQEKNNLLQLNFLSSQKAKQSAAFQLAYDYLKTAMDLLDEDHWQKDYSYTLNVYNSTAEVAYCVANYAHMNQVVSIILKNAKSSIDKLECYSLQIRAYFDQRLQNKVLETGLIALECFGEQLSLTPITEILHEIEKIKQKLRELQFDLKTLPKITDEYKLAALRILSELGIIFYFYMPKFFPVITSKCF